MGRRRTAASRDADPGRGLEWSRQYRVMSSRYSASSSLRSAPVSRVEARCAVPHGPNSSRCRAAQDSNSISRSYFLSRYSVTRCRWPGPISCGRGSRTYCGIGRQRPSRPRRGCSKTSRARRRPGVAHQQRRRGRQQRDRGAATTQTEPGRGRETAHERHVEPHPRRAPLIGVELVGQRVREVDDPRHQADRRGAEEHQQQPSDHRHDSRDAPSRRHPGFPWYPLRVWSGRRLPPASASPWPGAARAASAGGCRRSR